MVCLSEAVCLLTWILEQFLTATSPNQMARKQKRKHAINKTGWLSYTSCSMHASHANTARLQTHFRRVKHVWQQEVKQRPQFMKIVLQWRSRQQQTVRWTEFTYYFWQLRKYTKSINHKNDLSENLVFCFVILYSCLTYHWIFYTKMYNMIQLNHSYHPL